MPVREAIERRLGDRRAVEDDAGTAALPRTLRGETGVVRIALFRRLSASRMFALGDRAGVLSAAQRRSGRPFRLDVRQRVVVKVLVSRHHGRGGARGSALARHVSYLGRSGAGAEGDRPVFFTSSGSLARPASVSREWSEDRHHFRVILSPEHGDRIEDLPNYVREVMARVASDLGEPELTWVATCHFDTDQPHAHVLIRGRRSDDRDLVIPKDYVAYGIRARAQEVAQERLGDLTRAEAERRVWRETEADRYTGFDRRLLAARDSAGLVDDGLGRSGAWSALTRGRLRHLERLGLAIRIGVRYRLAPDLETQLRRLQLRRDIIRTLNQRRLEGASVVRELGAEPVRGKVVRSGFHDELGAAPFLVVRDNQGTEHYARLGLGQAPPPSGAEISIARAERGVWLALGKDRLNDLGL